MVFLFFRFSYVPNVSKCVNMIPTVLKWSHNPSSHPLSNCDMCGRGIYDCQSGCIRPIGWVTYNTFAPTIIALDRPKFQIQCMENLRISIALESNVRPNLITNIALDGLSLVPGTWYQVPGTWYQVPGTRYLVPGTWYQVPGTWYQVPGIRYQIPGTRDEIKTK